MTNDPNQKTYFSTIGKIEQNSLLKDVKLEACPVYLWEEGQEEEQLQEFTVETYDVNNSKICLTFKGKMLSRLLGTDLAGKDVYLKLTFQKIQYFTHGDLTHDKSSNLYYFSPKHAFYKGQKRTNYRLMSDEQVRIQVKLDETVYECFDISASGISLMLPAASKNVFIIDTVYKESTIRLAKADFTISEIQVKGIFTQNERKSIPHDKIQVGMAFTKINKDSEENLFLAINSEARSAEMRKKFGKKP